MYTLARTFPRPQESIKQSTRGGQVSCQEAPVCLTSSHNIMSEHHTQGRQGQGARRRRHYHSNRNYRHRMPRPKETKTSLFKRVLSFFGIGKKNKADKGDGKKNLSGGAKSNLPQKVRVAQPRSSRGGNPAAAARPRRKPVSVPPTEQARLYVGNLSFETTEAELEDLFKGFGHVRSVEIIYNSRTYRSKGYAFVEMEQLSDAVRAAEQLHGQPFMGRELRVSAASEKVDYRNDDERKTFDSPANPHSEPPTVSQPEEDGEETLAFGEEVVVPLGQAAESADSAKSHE